MRKKVVVLGGGNGMGKLLKGLKQFPINITSVVSVADSGKSTGILREEFNTPAVGDIRRIIISLSEYEPLLEEIFNYRFNTSSDLNGHTIGNLLLTATTDKYGSLSEGIKSLSNILNLKGKVLPLTEDNVNLVATMQNGKIVHGEAEITASNMKIKEVYYEKTPKVNNLVISEIKSADLIILSMGSVYTSVIPNLLCKDVIKAIDEAKAPILYITNLMTQPGETDNFNVTDHVNTINKYLGNKKISIVLANNGKISPKIRRKYLAKEQKDPVTIDNKIQKNENIVLKQNNYVKVENEVLVHNTDILALDIYSYLIFKKTDY